MNITLDSVCQSLNFPPYHMEYYVPTKNCIDYTNDILSNGKVKRVEFACKNTIEDTLNTSLISDYLSYVDMTGKNVTLTDELPAMVYLYKNIAILIGGLATFLVITTAALVFYALRKRRNFPPPEPPGLPRSANRQIDDKNSAEMDRLYGNT